MIARFDSDCDGCGNPIEAGVDEVFHSVDGWVCETCHEDEDDELPVNPRSARRSWNQQK